MGSVVDDPQMAQIGFLVVGMRKDCRLEAFVVPEEKDFWDARLEALVMEVLRGGGAIKGKSPD